MSSQAATSPKLSPRLSLPEPVSEQRHANFPNSVEFYETRVSSLVQQLHEEEEYHKLLLVEKENRIQELQDALETTTAARIDPTEESRRSSLLEERIVEMTILIEEKDRRIFHLQSEIDQLREQISSLRSQVDRIPELESTINNLDNTLAGIRRLSSEQSGDMPENDDDDDSDEEAFSEKPEDEFVVQLRSKISSLETTIMDLDRLVITLRTEKDSMTVERDSTMDLLRQKEEQFRMEMEDVMRTHAIEMKINDETITSLREKIFTLQDKLETAEMAKISLTTELEMEQARRTILESSSVAETVVAKPEMVSRPVSPLPLLTESIPTVVAPTPVMASPEMIPVSTITPQMMSPKLMSPKIVSPEEKNEDENVFEVETENGSTLAVSERVKAIIERQREQIEELNFELIALRLKVAEEMVSPNNKRILSAGDSSKSTPSDQFVIPHRDLVPPLSPRMPAANQPMSPPAAGCTGCFPSMFRKQKNRNILV